MLDFLKGPSCIKFDMKLWAPHINHDIFVIALLWLEYQYVVYLIVISWFQLRGTFTNELDNIFYLHGEQSDAHSNLEELVLLIIVDCFLDLLIFMITSRFISQGRYSYRTRHKDLNPFWSIIKLLLSINPYCHIFKTKQKIDSWIIYKHYHSFIFFSF